jgi:hypothetical protein
MRKERTTPQHTQIRTSHSTKTLDIGALLKKHGYWYGSAKIRVQEQWLISFWNGMLLSNPGCSSRACDAVFDLED